MAPLVKKVVGVLKGEDVRNSQWFRQMTDDLIKYYVKMKNEGATLLRGEITITERKGKVLEPHWFFYIQKKGDSINLPVED